MRPCCQECGLELNEPATGPVVVRLCDRCDARRLALLLMGVRNRRGQPKTSRN